MSHSSSSSAAAAAATAGMTTSTYEATKAYQSTQTHPDRIHWDGNVAFRDQPYRLLHHQRGLIGMFRVRLLEAADLKRSYWSALALGPVKHLGLSTAHGAVSSFCTFSLQYEDAYKNSNGGDEEEQVATVVTTPNQTSDWDRKPAAKPRAKNASTRPAAAAAASERHVSSPTVMQDNNPVWENCQFEFPFCKGALPVDGMRVCLQVRVQEDATAVENFLPGIPSGGDARLLGVGTLDLTELCLGETANGQVLPGVRDAWIPISLAGIDKPEDDDEDEEGFLSRELPFSKEDPLAPPKKDKHHTKKDGDSNDPPAVTGMVRVLVSYQPVGLEPQPKDIVALEAFARRNHPAATTCRPLLQPLMPLTVVDRRGAYLLCEYNLPGSSSGHRRNKNNSNNNKACIRIHRNAVFVIERQNLVDAAHNLALLPFDVMVSTPVGQATANALGPAVAAGREILMPALLSLKLVWMAARTTTLAGVSGVQALGGTLWQEGTSSLTASHRNHTNSHHHHHNSSSSSSRVAASYKDGRAGTAQFVQL